MAPTVLIAEYLLFNSVDFTDHIRGATIELEGAKVETTAMGTGGATISWETSLIGVRSGNLNIEVIDDFAASSIDATVWAAFLAGTAVPFELRPSSAAVSTSNPKLTGSILPIQYRMGGSLGELAVKSLTLPTTGAIARATS